MIAKKALTNSPKKAAAMAGPAALLAALSAPALLAQAPGASPVPDASAFTPVPRYAIAFDQPRDLAEFYLRTYGLKTYGADIEQFDHPGDENKRVLLITIDPIKGSQVSGVQWRFDIAPSEGTWSTVEAGMRRKCSSGPKAGEWTKDECP